MAITELRTFGLTDENFYFLTLIYPELVGFSRIEKSDVANMSRETTLVVRCAPCSCFPSTLLSLRAFIA